MKWCNNYLLAPTYTSGMISLQCWYVQHYEVYLTMQEYLTETLGILTYSLYIILYNIYLIWFFSTVKTISRVDNASYLWPACSTVRVMETPSGGSLLSYRMNNFKTATNWMKDFFVRVISSKIDMKC